MMQGGCIVYTIAISLFDCSAVASLEQEGEIQVVRIWTAVALNNNQHVFQIDSNIISYQ